MIYMYRKLTPNFSENTHYFFNNQTKYIEALGDNYITIADDKYQINNGALTVYLAANAPFYREFTYVAWFVPTLNRYTFFHVRSVEWQSGYAIYSLDIDLWGTYIDNADISNIRINRSTRHVSYYPGIFDEVGLTYNRSFEALEQPPNIDDLSIVATIAVATGVSSIVANGASTTLAMYVFDYSDITDVPTGYNKLLWGIDKVGGIIGRNVGAAPSIDANVINAYIVPSETLALGATDIIFKTIPPGKLEQDFAPTAIALPYIHQKEFNMLTSPQYKYIVGTRFDGLEILSTTEGATIIYNFLTKQDGIDIIVQQGGLMRDISKAFQVGLTSNDGAMTGIQKISKVLDVGRSFAHAALSLGSGNPYGVVNIAEGLANMTNYNGNALYTPGGDALTTYLINTVKEGLIVQCPYYVQKFESIGDELEKVMTFGAKFDEIVSNVETVFSLPYVYPQITHTFIAANATVGGIPTEAAFFIKNEIATGIFCELLK